MASIIQISLKDDNGKWTNYTLTINNELDKFGNAGFITLPQTQQEREAKVNRVFLGNAKVVWTDGQNVDKTPFQEKPNKANKVDEDSFF